MDEGIELDWATSATLCGGEVLGEAPTIWAETAEAVPAWPFPEMVTMGRWAKCSELSGELLKGNSGTCGYPGRLATKSAGPDKLPLGPEPEPPVTVMSAQFW